MDKQAFGHIIKKEQLESPKGFSNNNDLLLVASNPFPGFKGKSENKYYYLVLDDKIVFSVDELIRITQKIKRSFKNILDVYPCEITVYNKFYNALRIYNQQLKDIEQLVELYKMYGLSFQKNQVVSPYISQLKVIKFFELTEISDGLYRSISVPNFKYIKVQEKIEWDEFETLVDKANQEEMFSNCDFAIACFHSKDGFDYFIRILSDSCTIDNLKTFREFIFNTINKQIIN